MRRQAPTPPLPRALTLRLAAAISAATLLGGTLASAQAPLSGAPSPHLRHHSHGPVQWMPWGNVAFTKAEEAKKLVYCSIGYHACHWCRLMDRESFRNEDIAKLINKNFVPVKVDRLLRPDIDLAFRSYAIATGNSSGWPVNVWITPAGNPVSVGSYFAPTTNAAGSPGLDKVIAHITKQWTAYPKYVHEQSERDLIKIRERVKRKLIAELEPADPVEMRNAFYTAIAASFDPVSGGFDATIKFPRPEIIQALCVIGKSEPEGSFRRKQVIKMVTRTLDGMLSGAIIDPLDGGMFRYANDSSWRVPQFEKMLVDQARFAYAALDVFELTGEQRYADAAVGTLEFAASAFKMDSGGYAASLAADGEQLGQHYAWTQDELKALLSPDEFAALAKACDVQPGGNAPPYSTLSQLPDRANILRAATPDARAPTAGSPLASAMDKVRAARMARSNPARNETILTGNNGLVIGALARAGKLLDDAALRDAAASTASYVTSTLFDPITRKLRRAQIGEQLVGDGFAEDYIFLARGLIDLHLATGNPEALATAAALQATADEAFYHAEIGLYHLTPVSEIDKLPLPLWSTQDTDLPSYNGIAVRNLIDLARLSKSPISEHAAQLVTSLAPDMERSPSAAPSALLAALALKATTADR